jgi:hypothetical protein
MMNTKKLIILLCLAAIFLAPGLAAYIFYHHTQWLSSAKTNKGEIVRPNVELSFLTQNKWKLILWSPGECDESCRIAMDKLARIRLALGRRLYQVDALLLRKEQTRALSMPFIQQLKDEDIHIRQLSSQEAQVLEPWSTQSKIFIVNPEGYLVLAYALTSEPNDIYQDLKHLLHTKE